LHHKAIVEIEESIAKVNRYSSDGAEAAHARGKRASLSRAVASGLWTFFRIYVLRRGFLDGRHGFLLAVLNAEGAYYRYVKLWLKADRKA
jgi:hypothetical protein